MSNIDKIRQEIERLRCESGPEHFDFYDLLDYFKEFIDSLQEENNPEPYNPVYDEDYLNEKIAKATKSWEGVDVDAYMDEVRGREPEQPSEN